MRCKCVVLISAVCFLLGLQSVAAPQYAFRIYFHDKIGAPTLGSANSFLSQRALDRRTAQGIALDSTDRPVSPDYIDSVLSLTSGKLHMTSKWLNSCVLLLNDSSQILHLQGKPYIDSFRYISYYATPLHKSVVFQNSKFNKEIPISGTAKTTSYYGSADNQVTMVNGDYLHNLGYRGKGKWIAVLDEGFANIDAATGFDSIRSSGRLIDRYDFVAASSTINTTSDHGTSCLSTMAGTIPNTYVGSAPDASYAVYCTEIIASPDQELEMDNMLAAAEHCDSLGIDIISASIGYNDFLTQWLALYHASIDGYTSIAAKAANMATKKGMLFVASAGNEGGGSWNYILTPGDADSAITIGSVDQNEVIASSSGYGPNASGVRKPDVCMQGEPASVLKDGTNVFSIPGTSFATPQLAGWAACLWQATGPATTPGQIKRAIVASANRSVSPDYHYGYGVPDFKKALDYLGVKDTPKPTADWIRVLPNPFRNALSVQIIATVNERADIIITDISGRIVYHKSAALTRGDQSFIITPPALASGVYILRIAANSFRNTMRIVKQ